MIIMSNDQQQKTRIISAATNLFARFGLEKTTMADIAKASKKAKSSLYYYFESKEQVFAEVIRYEIDGLKYAIVEAIEKEDDPRNQLRRFVSTRLNYLNEKAGQYITIKDEYLKHYEFIENLTVDYSIWEISTIRTILDYGRKKGVFEITDLEPVAKAFFFALKGSEYPWTINLPLEEIEKSVDVLIDILLKGIRKG